MSKADRNRQQAARERIAAQRAAARKAEIRKRTLAFGGAILAVVAIVVAIVVVKANSGTPKATASSTVGTLLPASVTSDVNTVPATTLSSVGAGSVPSYAPAAFTNISGTPLTSGGKPEVLYIGAEFCPYCAAMRWSVAVALSRFGTLSPLHGIRSSGSDVFPNTATLTFYKSSYTSKYLNYTSVEVQKVDRSALQNPTTQQNQIWTQYEPDASTRGYPFIDFGNKYLIKAPIYNPQVLAGKSWAQIAAALKDPASPIAQGAVGAANYITAAICKLTGNQPANVCTAAPIPALQAHL
jgi:thiol-disulfide isomerase/thioredoxin